MDRFARVILGYHGCEEDFGRSLLEGVIPFEKWEPSQNMYDWLGHGIYFWEHSPTRALRWAMESCNAPFVVGAVIQLGNCFDLMNEYFTELLAESHRMLNDTFRRAGKPLPQNRGLDRKMRDLDCLVINECLNRLELSGIKFDTVRGTFEEGDPAYAGAGFRQETHIQIAVRELNCVLGVFRPNLGGTT